MSRNTVREQRRSIRAMASGADLETAEYMASRPTERACGKQRYESKKDTETARNRVIADGRARPYNLRIYECPECGGWHLAGRKQEGKRRG